MFILTFSPEKNCKLIDERNISFEEIIAPIEDGQVIDILEHPNSKDMRVKKIYVISAKEYVYLVPFVIDAEGNVFFKTIIPSRKAKKQYKLKE